MRYAIIENNIVTNIVVSDRPLNDNWVEVVGGVDIGYLWDGSSFSKPEIVKDYDAEWEEIRKTRDALLVSTDWWTIKAADSGRAITPEQQAYRQALRDITLQEDPFNVVWPTEPQ